MARLEMSDDTWEHVVFRVAFNAATHPIDYAKCLIQIGHEPMAPYEGHTIFGAKKHFYPSIFSYIAHIKRRDGLSGCYRGLPANLCSKVVGGLACQRAMAALEVQDEEEDPATLPPGRRARRAAALTLRESLARAAGILASHPLHVAALRTMAQFVGQDQRYGGLRAAYTVVCDSGLSGLYAGVGPRLLCDLGCVWLSGAAIYAANSLLLEDKDARAYAAAVIKFVINTLMYPLNVVSTCMAVTGAGLVAAQPPHMPVYASAAACWRHLAASGGLKRGSTLLWRAYTGPQLLGLLSPAPDVALFAPPPSRRD